MANVIDEAMRTPATELTGPNDPKVDVIIAYLRSKGASGSKPERKWWTDEDLETIKKMTPAKSKAFRRF